MLRRIWAGALTALVLCPFTAPFSASDAAVLFGDPTDSPLASSRHFASGSKDSTSVGVVQLRVRGPHGPRLVLLPVAKVVGVVAPSNRAARRPLWTTRVADEHLVSPSVLRI